MSVIRSFLVQENHSSSHSGYANHSETMKSSRNGEEIDYVQKKKDVFRPSILDLESGRADRWRDEERETNSSGRKDRWREGDKEHGDTHKVDRWTDNSSGRHLAEARRAPSERWTDSSNRETNYDQRRESKWNTRWGPDNRGTDSLREKWNDPTKDTDTPLDKGLSHPVYHGKDEREGDHHRPWRSNSHSQGKVEPPLHQTSMPNKKVLTFVHGRGRGEITNPTFSLGRGRVGSGGSPMNINSTHSHSLGSFSEKGEGGHGENSPLRYSRTKLLDLYRNTDMRSHGKILDRVLQVPSLAQEDPIEPLAFYAPTPEELVLPSYTSMFC